MPAYTKSRFLKIGAVVLAAQFASTTVLSAQSPQVDQEGAASVDVSVPASIPVDASVSVGAVVSADGAVPTGTAVPVDGVQAQPLQAKKKAPVRKREFQPFPVNGSIFFPYYIAERTVYDRGVANMPVLNISPQIGQYMKEMPAKYNKHGVITSVNVTSYNLPIYIVDSRDPSTPRARVNVPSFRDHMVSSRMREILFNDNIPIPDWARPANGGDSAMAIYDIGTGVIREYFLIKKDAERQWTASYGGYYVGLMNLSRDNYACQLTEGSDFVTAMVGAPGQIGIAEARAGEIRHAVCFTMANAHKGLWSWPAKQGDGTDDYEFAPAQGQWFRLPPDLDIDRMNLKPMTKLIAKAVQKYGGFGSDKNLFCHAFNAEPGFVEEHVTGQDPWQPGGDLYQKYQLGSGNLINDFPWELTQWAPIDWGKPGGSQRGR